LKGPPYWLSFRQSNDWYKLVDWSKVNINTGYERKLAQMKVKKQNILDESQSWMSGSGVCRKWLSDSVGGQLLIGLASVNKLHKNCCLSSKKLFSKTLIRQCVSQAGNYFKRPASGKTYSINTIAQLPADVLQG
jgi:hypothetical protein